jgi:hypothetical protein
MPGGAQIVFVPGSIQEKLTDFAVDSFNLIVINGPRTLPGFSGILARCRELCLSGGIICGTGSLLDATQVNPKGHAHGLRFRMNFIHDENTGKYYHPEITESLKILGAETIATAGFWAFLNGDVPEPVEVPTMDVTSNGEVAETAFFRIMPGLHSQWLAVSKSISEVSLFSERIGERTIPELVYVCADKEEAMHLALTFEKGERRKNGILLDETDHYWLGKYGQDVYLAQSKYMSPDEPFQIFESRIGDCELRPAIVKGATLSELREKVAAQESTIQAGKASLPCILTYQDYIIYAGAGGLLIAVQKDLESFAGEEDMEPYVLLGKNTDELKERINRIANQYEKGPLSGSMDVDEWM